MLYLIRTFFILAALAGCSTPYQENRGLGGVTAVPEPGGIVRIQSEGNAATSDETALEHALHKAAETTLAQGYRYFEAVEIKQGTRLISKKVYNTYLGKYGGFQDVWETHPHTDLRIRMLAQGQPGPSDGTIYDARALLARFEPSG